jgi:hypothetical protein
MDLMELARDYPEMTVSIRLCDLLEANEALVRKVRAEEEKETARQMVVYKDTLIAKEEARVRLLGGVDPSTLWRWEKRGYLRPVRIGVKVFYRRSDIDTIIKRNETK